MLSVICNHIKNYFCKNSDKHFGEFTIASGSIEPLAFLQDGQYFAIWGSAFNDGVYQYPTSELTDEVFEGSVWAMSVPPAFVALADEIEAYDKEDKPSAFTSESYGGYSYSKATGSNGVSVSWKQVFADRLNDYRKVRL